jgi:hypothetical protein
LIQSKSEVDKKKKLPGHVVSKILREAILLWQKTRMTTWKHGYSAQMKILRS